MIGTIMSDMNFNDLKKPFPTKDINWKVGLILENGTKGQAIPHLDARAVQNRLDDVVGQSGWKNKFIEIFNGPTLFSVRCILSLKVEGEWIDKEDAATLATSSTNGFIDRNSATKGVYSDALKRAAVQWGIGRYLYDYTPEVVDLDEHNRICAIPRLPKEFVPVDEHAAYFAITPEKTSAQAAKEIVATRANANEPSTPAEALKPAISKPETVVSPEQEHTPKEEDLPTEILEAEKALVKEILLKLEKNHPNIIKAYVQGPKGMKKFSEAAVAYILKKANEKEASLA